MCKFFQNFQISNILRYGGVVNLAQRMEDAGRYKSISADNKTMIPFEPEETPSCVITVTLEVFKELNQMGEFAKFGVDMEQVSVLIKGETEPRLAHRWKSSIH